MERPCLIYLIPSFLLINVLPLSAEVDYEKEILPILEDNCLDCHGPDKDKSGFRVDLRTVLLTGGDSGLKSIVPGDPDANLFDQHLMGYSLRTDRYRYTAWLDRRDPMTEPLAEELYDHDTDPHETANVAKANPETTKRLLVQLRAQFQ